MKLPLDQHPAGQPQGLPEQALQAAPFRQGRQAEPEQFLYPFEQLLFDGGDDGWIAHTVACGCMTCTEWHLSGAEAYGHSRESM